MALKMDLAELTTFLQRDFMQVAEDFTITEVTEAMLEVRLNVTAKHLRPGGTVSGPSMFALADVGLYLAILSRLGPVALAVTTNCAIDFMRKP
jgi:acyl-coenzyme A thioesterase PaaI-like protein